MQAIVDDREELVRECRVLGKPWPRAGVREVEVQPQKATAGMHRFGQPRHGIGGPDRLGLRARRDAVAADEAGGIGTVCGCGNVGHGPRWSNP